MENKLLNIGEYVKIKESILSDWTHEGLMQIIGYANNKEGEKIYKVTNFIFDSIYPEHVYQNDECIKKSRIKKLKRIIK